MPTIDGGGDATNHGTLSQAPHYPRATDNRCISRVISPSITGGFDSVEELISSGDRAGTDPLPTGGRNATPSRSCNRTGTVDVRDERDRHRGADARPGEQQATEEPLPCHSEVRVIGNTAPSSASGLSVNATPVAQAP